MTDQPYGAAGPIPSELAPAQTHLQRLSTLIGGALSPPSGRGRIGLALACGLACHACFAAAVIAMIATMYTGLTSCFGTVPWPWSALANAVLVAQFPLGHSLLLTRAGRNLLARLPLGTFARDLSTTSYATIASLQLLALFTLWTPSGIVWWRAEGLTHTVLTICYGASWLLLIKASFDAGPEVQSGALGWLSVLQAKAPVFPSMPVTGLFRFIRQPIYLAFALTLWTVPIWTPDQLALALTLTAYCLIAPVLKERRFVQYYGARFELYRTSFSAPCGWRSFLSVIGPSIGVTMSPELSLRQSDQSVRLLLTAYKSQRRELRSQIQTSYLSVTSIFSDCWPALSQPLHAGPWASFLKMRHNLQSCLSPSLLAMLSSRTLLVLPRSALLHWPRVCCVRPPPFDVQDRSGRFAELRRCAPAWNFDPVGGVIGVQN